MEAKATIAPWSSDSNTANEDIIDTGVYRFLKHVVFDPRFTKLTLLNDKKATGLKRLKAKKGKRNQ